jgi:co-chaperonin GroES (HSP10)
VIKPVLHRILVKPAKLEETDDSYKRAIAAGLALPDLSEKAREQAAISEGTVVDMGGTVYKDFHTDSPIVIGDYVVYAKFSGRPIEDRATKELYILLNDEDVLAIIK